jgi:hypothetical protein
MFLTINETIRIEFPLKFIFILCAHESFVGTFSHKKKTCLLCREAIINFYDILQIGLTYALDTPHAVLI